MFLLTKELLISILNYPNVIYNAWLLRYKKVVYESYPIITGKLYIAGQGQIILGKEVRINSSLSANPIGGDTRTIFSVDKGALLKIGSNSGLSNVAISCKKEVKIGANVKIGGSVKIYDSDFHALQYDLRNNKHEDKPIKKAIELKDGCFIGAHSIILKGVTIGQRSIIGAGSVVTKSVPDNEIWGGNPIKFIKKIDV